MEKSYVEYRTEDWRRGGEAGLWPTASGLRGYPSLRGSSSGPPALSGFPVVLSAASDMGRPLVICEGILFPGFASCSASHVDSIRASA